MTEPATFTPSPPLYQFTSSKLVFYS